MADPAALLRVLESDPAGTVRLELVLPDRSRCRVARFVCEGDLRRLIDAIRQSGDGWLELVFAKDHSGTPAVHMAREMRRGWLSALYS
jgi:hypothetical protein